MAIEHDVIVVGSGSAGGPLAARLSEDPSLSVLLLEAGADVTSRDDLPDEMRGGSASRGGRAVRASSYLWSYDVQLMARGGRTAQQVRGRLLGGSSSVNGANFARGIPEDYDSWGSPLWRFDQVLPYFRKLETDMDFHDRLHGGDGPISVWRVPRDSFSPLNHSFYEAGLRRYPEKLDLNHPDGEGLGPATRNDVGNLRVSVAWGYVTPARARPNLTVRPNATVRRVLFDGRRAVGVEVLAAGRKEVLHAREVVLSAGVFASPQLLLLSGVGPAAQLRQFRVPLVQDLPGVGRNLNCNPSVKVRVGPMPSGGEPADSSTAPQTFIVYTAAGSPDRSDMSLMPREVDGTMYVQCQVRLPSSSGELRLRSADPAVAPLIGYGYLHERDVARLAEAVTLVGDLMNEPSLARIAAAGPPSEAEPSEGWILANFHTPYHAGGTCKLGAASDERAVVDERCRVRGVDGLRVVDLSILPQPVRAGPAATAVMIGERAADLIREDLTGPER